MNEVRISKNDFEIVYRDDSVNLDDVKVVWSDDGKVAVVGCSDEIKKQIEQSLMLFDLTNDIELW